MRVLHLTDTHLGAHLGVLGHEPLWHRSQDHERAMARALEPALTGQVDLVVHSGDVFQRSRPPPAARAAAVRLLQSAARVVPVVVMPGNHDRHGLRGSIPNGLPGLHVVDAPARFEFGGVALAFVPFRGDAEHWAASARKAVGPGADAIVAHQAFDGARVPGLTFRAGRQRDTVAERQIPRGVPHVLCGHIHPRQVSRFERSTVVYPGSTERTSFTEAPQTKGYAIWEWGRTVRWRFVDLPTRPMVVLREEGDLARVEPGSLVRVQDGPRTAELVSAGMQLGGWVRAPARHRASPQLALFG